MESLGQSKEEDKKRIRGMSYAVQSGRGEIDADDVCDLIGRLSNGLETGNAFPTIASSVYSRRLRKAEVHLVSRHLTALKTREIAYGHVVNRRWAIKPEELALFDIPKFMERFRYHLRKCGSEGASGFLLARLHGEHEPNENLLWPHMHVVATGGMIDVLERAKRYYKRYDVECGPRTKVLLKAEADRLAQLSYVFQSFWPCRYRGPAADDPKRTIRQRQKQRIPEPIHSAWLLKMDSSEPADLLLVIGSPKLSNRLRKLYKTKRLSVSLKKVRREMAPGASRGV